jgi:biopolymer transport protein ExbD
LNFEDIDKPIVEINITPFVDILLVLLVIFMVTSSMITQHHLSLDLPGAASSSASQQKFETKIVVDKHLKLKINEQDLNFEEFKNLKMTSPVSLSADKTVPYEILVKIMDILQNQGVQGISLNVIQGK